MLCHALALDIETTASMPSLEEDYYRHIVVESRFLHVPATQIPA